MNRTSLLLKLLLLLSAFTLTVGCTTSTKRIQGSASGPAFAVDASWPKPLPNNWILGQVAGIATDKNDHIWIIQRPRTLTEDERGASTTPPRSTCCVAAPAVMEFDRKGNFLRGWGGAAAGYDWPKNEHGIYVDPKGDVWIGGNDNVDHMLLKFTADGKFLLQIGSPGKSLGSNATNQLGRPAHMELDVATNELFVADGYQNKRVIVFDASTGAYKRHWGAYGNKPDDTKIPDYNPESPQFANPVHCVRLMKDQTLLVCDRSNNRIQIFTKDGKFLRQIVSEPNTRGSGSIWDLVVSEDPAQKYILLADGANNEVRILLRETGEKIGSFGRSGRQAGDFHWVHNIAIDSQGNIYTSEVDNGKRIQKFERVK
jgi:DNA-binding beta-propeller fold protein YncE